MTVQWIDIAGWTGAVVLLVAYVLVAMRKLEGHGARYHALNLIGSAGLAVNSAVNGAFPSAVLNAIWMAVGLAVLVRRRD